MRRGTATCGRERKSRRFSVLATLLFLGFALQLLVVGIIPLLPLIGKSLKISPATASWLITASLLAGAVFLVIFSRLADMIGKTPVIQLSLALVLVGSLIGCFVQSFTGLLIARILMGAVLPMLALPEAVAADTMPRERANIVIGAIHAATGVGIAGGLVLGALAGAGEASWRWFFIVGAITSALGILATRMFLHDSARRPGGRLDLSGAGLLGAGLVGLLLALSQGPAWGWGSVRVWGVGVLSLVILGLWVVQQRRSRDPLIDVQRLVSHEVRIPLAMTFLAAFGIYSALTAITRFAVSKPAEVGYGYGWKPIQVAWYAAPEAMGCLLGFILIRRLIRAGRPVAALTAGFVTLIGAFALFELLTAHPFFTLLGLGVWSLGLATILAVSQMVAIRSVDESASGIVLGLTIVLYAVGNAVGSAVVAVWFQSFGSTPKAPSLTAFHAAFAGGGIAALLALALCWPLARRTRSPSPTRSVSSPPRQMVTTR